MKLLELKKLWTNFVIKPKSLSKSQSVVKFTGFIVCFSKPQEEKERILKMEKESKHYAKFQGTKL